jgi:hypothetical protein
VFGCHVVYVLNTTHSCKALNSRTQTDLRDIVTNQGIDGYFMGYANTTKVVFYWDPKTNKIEQTHHCMLDEFDTRVSQDQKHSPGSLLLAKSTNGLHNSTPMSAKDIEFKVSHFDIATSTFPTSECETFTVPIPLQEGH